VEKEEPQNNAPNSQRPPLAADQQKLCVECCSPIPTDARVCPICKGFQQRWKTNLWFISSNFALVVAAVSVLLWSSAQVPRWLAEFFPRTEIIALACNSTDGAVLCNAGNDPVFVSHVMLFSKGQEWVAQELPVNKTLEPGKFLKVLSPAPPFKGHLVRKATQEQLQQIVRLAAGSSGKGDCARIVIFAKTDPKFREVSEMAGPALTTIGAGGYIEYFSPRTPSKAIRKSLPAIGAVLVSTRSGCPKGLY
jgi:hypothetical protein